MLVLGIDPGSVITGWALLEGKGRKVRYITSGVLRFNKDVDFLKRLCEIKLKSENLFKELNPTEIAFESLIYVKSPTALIKLAQTRGVLLSSLLEPYENKIFEYSPNLVKSSAVGDGHASKESVRKVLDMIIGKRDYETHDESDAVAIALCHIMNKSSRLSEGNRKPLKKTGKSGLAHALAHRIGEV